MKRALCSLFAVTALAMVVLSSSPAAANPECLGSTCGRPVEGRGSPLTPLEETWQTFIAAVLSAFSGE